jgi:peroxiredoxin
MMNTQTENKLAKRDNFYSLPDDLPVPLDDGACDHLNGLTLPNLILRSTLNRDLNLFETSKSKTVFFFYPRTGRPDEPAPIGWDQIPGARGCTPQSCGYRDAHSKFHDLGIQIFGVSTQTTDFQQELVRRIHLPFEVLSDSEFKLTESLRLPTFEFNSMRLLRRLALFVENSTVQKVFYPVFPPNENASQVLTWMETNKAL